MRKTKETFWSCALVVAVALGCASKSAAEPIGPTGKTTKECWDAFGSCLDDCSNSYAECLKHNTVGTCDIANTICGDDCQDQEHQCLPAKINKADLKLNLLVNTAVKSLAVQEVNSATLGKLGDVMAQVIAALPVDLVPLSSFQCARDHVDLNVANHGNVPAPASTTHVDFANSSGVDMATPAIGVGASATVTFAIPATCFVSNKCSFTPTVDSANAVTESNESNNSVSLVCDLT